MEEEQNAPHGHPRVEALILFSDKTLFFEQLKFNLCNFHNISFP